MAWNEKYNLEWFRTQSPEEAHIITQLIENQGYGGAKVSNVTAPDLRERNQVAKISTTADSRNAQNKPEVTSNHSSIELIKPRRAVLITIVYDDGSSQVIPVDPNSKFNQFLGQ